MASATKVRDWATIDYYALLGIEATADADAVTRAFREQAKQSHPDATEDDAAAARFNDVAAAYAVLSDPGMRRDYDRVRAELVVMATPAAVSTGPPVRRATARKPWTTRKAITVLVAGLLVFLLGVGAAVLTWSLHERDAGQRARFVPAIALRMEGSGAPVINFPTKTGGRVDALEPRRHGDPNGLSPTMKIRYDPADPTHVIVDSSTTARDVTFAIVALKLLVGGAVFAFLGLRKLRVTTAR